MRRSGSLSGPLTGTMARISGENRDNGSGRNKHISRHRCNKPGGLNLKAVAEVLTQHGMDPTEEIVKILRPLDEDGNVQPSKLPLDIQARIHTQLLEYCQPKLKSVEVKGRLATTSFDVTDEQAKLLAEEFLRAGVAA